MPTTFATFQTADMKRPGFFNRRTRFNSGSKQSVLMSSEQIGSSARLTRSQYMPSSRLANDGPTVYGFSQTLLAVQELCARAKSTSSEKSLRFFSPVSRRHAPNGPPQPSCLSTPGGQARGSLCGCRKPLSRVSSRKLFLSRGSVVPFANALITLPYLRGGSKIAIVSGS
jgi:hypothetical protein